MSPAIRPRSRRRDRPPGEEQGYHLVLSPVPPFDFALSALIFSGGDPQIRSSAGGMFRQVLRVGDSLFLVTVTASGSVDRPVVHVRLEPEPAGGKEAREAGETVEKIFNLGLDLSPFPVAVSGDPVMFALARRLRGLKPPRTPSVFEALVDSVIEQQISLAAAHGIERRVIRAFGDSLAWQGEEYYAFPTPARLADALPGDLRACGLSGRKAEYIIGIAGRVRDGTLDLEGHGPGEDTGAIIRELVGIRGVGLWTAELTVLRGLSRLDALPADDLGIRRSIAAFYAAGSRIDAAGARRIAGRWGAWKGLAAYYLMVAGMLGIDIRAIGTGP